MVKRPPGGRSLATSEKRDGNVLAEHRAIVEVVPSGDAGQAAAAVADHLAKTVAVLRCLLRGLR
jgi:DNA-binding FadR family transcriptional regulator